MLQVAEAVANRALCREHLRLTMRFTSFAPAVPGQFVHVCPAQIANDNYRTIDDATRRSPLGDDRATHAANPMLRRAFSVAGLRREPDGVYVDIIYRVVGTATRWLASLRGGESVSVLGPLGNGFPIDDNKKNAWLVAGGVGLPPMLYLAEALQQANKKTVAFCGAQARDLLALTLDAGAPPDGSASTATPSAVEFSRYGGDVVISTDDGSLGFHGHIGAALEAFERANPAAPDDLVIYTCGPERMMRFVAEWAVRRGIDCHVCMERAMACGTGLCQSCVVALRDESDPEGWRYRLCCTDGPVFCARDIIWDPAGGG